MRVAWAATALAVPVHQVARANQDAVSGKPSVRHIQSTPPAGAGGWASTVPCMNSSLDSALGKLRISLETSPPPDWPRGSAWYGWRSTLRERVRLMRGSQILTPHDLAGLCRDRRAALAVCGGRKRRPPYEAASRIRTVEEAARRLGVLHGPAALSERHVVGRKRVPAATAARLYLMWENAAVATPWLRQSHRPVPHPVGLPDFDLDDPRSVLAAFHAVHEYVPWLKQTLGELHRQEETLHPGVWGWVQDQQDTARPLLHLCEQAARRFGVTTDATELLPLLCGYLPDEMRRPSWFDAAFTQATLAAAAAKTATPEVDQELVAARQAAPAPPTSVAEAVLDLALLADLLRDSARSTADERRHYWSAARHDFTQLGFRFAIERTKLNELHVAAERVTAAAARSWARFATLEQASAKAIALSSDLGSEDRDRVVDSCQRTLAAAERLVAAWISPCQGVPITGC